MSIEDTKELFYELVRLNEARADITDDIKETCAVAKAKNINPKALRAAVKLHLDGPEKQQSKIEDETERDLILANLGLLPNDGVDNSENSGTRHAPVQGGSNIVIMGGA